MTSTPHPFEALTPDFILDAIEAQGFLSDGRILALNSYENRVYQVGIEDSVPLIAKFYRPGRWSDAQILEEHQFCYELEAQELSVVTPLRNTEGESLLHYQDFRLALFPRRGGRAPDLDNPDHLYQLGYTLGRMHLVGAAHPFVERPVLDLASFGYNSIELIARDFIPASLREAYLSLTRDLMLKVEAAFSLFDDLRYIRVHGDCHGGNLLWRDDVAHFVDFDDSRMAPAVQDLWMLLSESERSQRELQLAEVLAGYQEFADFDPRELHLVEPLRTLRMLHYSAWLARRWQDPAFPLSFPWFNTERYWGEHILQLREQLSALDEPVLRML
ncbi:MAG: serine/threonine protein kinase [Nitrincola lacisaponensis]|uniref:Stress response kinase A n=1 Tax=Nitrincola lacisaponensis TaxID=267850 RepID=A0A063Y4V4_9GAMM|nr:serine/threonine protein kinase [Nitrincola lacisaponensis]KDE40175.1 YihE protein, required for LPS synthesis [Nitrincola lacisaponensis]